MERDQIEDPWDFGSICSGIEAASIAFGPLGLVPAWFSEIEKFPNALLRHYYPEVKNVGNMCQLPELIRTGQIRAPRVVCGGTPCQSFSFGGKGESLSDPRGQLTLTFCEIVEAVDAERAIRGFEPCGVFWENVPGVLNKEDNPFGCFLGKLAGEDFALEPPGGRWSDAGCIVGPKRVLAWRILDAQFFRLAQRRKRLFVIGSSRDGFDPVKVLFEPEGMRRNSPPRRTPGEGTSQDVAPCIGASGGRGTERAGDSRGQDPIVGTWWDGSDISQTIDSVVAKRQTMPDKNRFPAVLVPDVAPTLDTMHNRKFGSNQWVNQGFGIITPALTEKPYGDNEAREGLLVAHTLKGEGFDGSEDGTGRGTPIVPVFALQAGIDKETESAGPQGLGVQEDIAYTLEARPTPSKQQAVAFQTRGSNLTIGNISGTLSGDTSSAAGAAPCIAFAENQRGEIRTSEVSPALGTGGGKPGSGYPAIAFTATQDGSDAGDIAPTLRAMMPDQGNANGGGQLAVAQAFETRIGRNGRGQPSDIAGTLGGADAGATSDSRPCALIGEGPRMAVRRLTPRECERLQGFADDYTLIPRRKSAEHSEADPPKKKKTGKAKKKQRERDPEYLAYLARGGRLSLEECKTAASDGPRYKAIGNSWAINCVQWIGKRLFDHLRELSEKAKK